VRLGSCEAVKAIQARVSAGTCSGASDAKTGRGPRIARALVVWRPKTKALRWASSRHEAGTMFGFQACRISRTSRANVWQLLTAALYLKAFPAILTAAVMRSGVDNAQPISMHFPSPCLKFQPSRCLTMWLRRGSQKNLEEDLIVRSLLSESASAKCQIVL
jgi:hypothetical protein